MKVTLKDYTETFDLLLSGLAFKLTEVYLCEDVLTVLATSAVNGKIYGVGFIASSDGCKDNDRLVTDTLQWFRNVNRSILEEESK